MYSRLVLYKRRRYRSVFFARGLKQRSDVPQQVWLKHHLSVIDQIGLAETTCVTFHAKRVQIVTTDYVLYVRIGSIRSISVLGSIRLFTFGK